jgi:hypothetical protein
LANACPRDVECLLRANGCCTFGINAVDLCNGVEKRRIISKLKFY